MKAARLEAFTDGVVAIIITIMVLEMRVLSIGLYAAAIVLAFIRPWAATALYVTVALIWLVPDTRIESLAGK